MSSGRVSIESDGRTYAGTWRLDHGRLTVSSSRGRKSWILDDQERNPPAVARVLLRELVAESDRQRDASEGRGGGP